MRAVFLDRDGVINPLIYSSDHGTMDSPLNPGQFEIFENAVEGIRLLNQNGIPAIIISNQPAIAKGKMTESLFCEIERKMKKILKKENCFIDGAYYCFHHPDAVIEKYRLSCDCRKPKPGLLKRAAREKGIDLRKSFFVGDSLSDIEAGKRAESKTVLVGDKKVVNFRKIKELNPEPDLKAPNLLGAVKAILGGGSGNLY